MDISINYLAVAVAAIASMVLGFLWYGPIFGKTWMKMMKINPDSIDTSGMNKRYALAILGSLITAYVLAHVISAFNIALDAEGLSSGIQAGFWVWLGFVATNTLGTVLWEGRPWKLWALNNAYNLLNLLVMGVILSLWV